MRPHHESTTTVAGPTAPVVKWTDSERFESVSTTPVPERAPGRRSLAESGMRPDVSSVLSWFRSRWALLLLALGMGAVVVEARTLELGNLQSAQAGMWPALVAGTGAVLLLVVASSERCALAGNQPVSGRQWRALLVALPALVGFPFLLAHLGFVIPTMIVSFYWLRVVVKQPWRMAAVSSALTTAAAYVTFVQLLAVPFPYGLLPVR